MAVIPLAEKFGWSATERGLVSSAFFWGYALTQVPAGYIAARLGGARVLAAAVFVWSAGTLVAPVAAAWGIFSLSFTRLIVGLGEGFGPAAVTALLAKHVPANMRARAVAIVFGGMELGNALADSAGPCGGGILAVSPDEKIAPVVLEAEEVCLRIGEAALVPA